MSEDRRSSSSPILWVIPALIWAASILLELDGIGGSLHRIAAALERAHPAPEVGK